jgi:hypothetical protein
MAQVKPLGMNYDGMPVILGMFAGVTTNIISASLAAAIIVAFLTGAAGYAGQQAAKYLQGRIKKYKNERSL